jgi:hypothetical protein
LQKYNFIPAASETALQKPHRALNECQEGYQLFENPLKLYQK